MGFTSWLRGDTALRGAPIEAALSGGGVVPVSPSMHRSLLALAGFATGQLPPSISRNDAMQVPALAAGVAILTGISAQLPLVADPSSEPEQLLTELDPSMPRGWTIAKTVDDLVFHGIAWWYVTSRTAAGFPRTVLRIANHRMNVDVAADRVQIDGVEVNPDDMIRFDGLTEGVLTTGAESITLALANVRQARVYATNPKPSLILTDEEGAEPLEVEEARAYIEAFSETIRDRGVGYIRGLQIRDFGWNATDIQLLPARQQDAVEMSRLLAIPTRYLAAPEQGSSLTYSNLAEVRRDLIEVGGLAQYLVPIEQRLSMPDVTPRGTVVKFDAESYFLRITPDAPNPETPQTEQP